MRDVHATFKYKLNCLDKYLTEDIQWFSKKEKHKHLA